MATANEHQESFDKPDTVFMEDVEATGSLSNRDRFIPDQIELTEDDVIMPFWPSLSRHQSLVSHTC